MAWLGATPKPPPGSKRAQTEGDKPRLSRLEERKKAGIAPEMPPNPMPHVTDHLIEMGLVEAAGMGTAALSWREIDAWCARTGVDLSPWEARLIRRLSVEYLAESRRAEDETCPPPWYTGPSQREIQSEQARLEMVLR